MLLNAYKIPLKCLTLAISISFIGSSYAAPYQPEDDSQVIATLSSQTPSAQNKQLRQQRTALAQSPNNAVLSQQLAEQYIQAAQQTQQPMYYQQAAAVLLPWENNKIIPDNLRLVRAMVYQHQHRFSKALHELKMLLQHHPDRIQAWWLRANIAAVVADYQVMRHSCTALLRLSNTTLSTLCLTQYGALTGKLDHSYKTLNGLLRQGIQSPQLALWGEHLAANMSRQQGQFKQAEQHFKRALALSPNHAQVLTDYTDALLDKQQYQKVRSLLTTKKPLNNALTLRLVLAQRKSGMENTIASEALNKTMSQLDTINSQSHLRARSRYTSEILNNPEQAFQLAQNNWHALQREPEDVKLLLQMALTVHNTDTLSDMKNWLQKTGLQDQRIASLLPGGEL